MGFLVVSEEFVDQHSEVDHECNLDETLKIHHQILDF